MINQAPSGKLMTFDRWTSCSRGDIFPVLQGDPLLGEPWLTSRAELWLMMVESCDTCGVCMSLMQVHT